MTQTLVALFDSVDLAERAVRDLRDHGVPDRDISLLVRDYNDHSDGQNGTAASRGARLGAALGGVGGLLVGLAALTIPGIGPVLAAGPLGTALAALVGVSAGAVAGGAAGGVLGALADAGIPRERAGYYAEAVRRGGTLLTVSVADADQDRVRMVLNNHDPVNVEERAGAWRQEGWTGYDPDAGPWMAAEPMRRGMGVAGQPDLTGDPGRAGSQWAYGEQPSRVVSTDYDRFAPAFRGHYQTRLAQSGYQYDHYAPAYQYGLTLGNHEPYRGLDWDQIEPEALLAWEERNPNTWERIQEAVRYGWERVRQPLRS